MAKSGAPCVASLFCRHRKENAVKGLLKSIADKISCRHEWHAIREIAIYSEFGYEHTRMICICPSCGKIRKIKY